MGQINIYSGNKPVSRVVTGGTLKDLDACLKPYRHIFAVVDSNVAQKCPAVSQLMDSLRRNKVEMMSLEPSEEHKTLDTVMGICSWLLENGADRDAMLLAVGGGITTDMVGFAASIYKRGVRFGYVPTTLLAQVDAAIGKILKNELKLENPQAQFMITKRIGQRAELAQRFERRLTKTSSLKMPTAFGIIPATAPRRK